MDAFGIGAAVLGAVEVYFRSARRSGRTRALLESLKPGDRIITLTGNEKRHLEAMIKELGVTGVEVLSVPVREFYDLKQYGTSQRQTYFDHGWLEEFYRQRLLELPRTIDVMQESLSGYGMKHVENKLAAREIAKWRI